MTAPTMEGFHLHRAYTPDMLAILNKCRKKPPYVHENVIFLPDAKVVSSYAHYTSRNREIHPMGVLINRSTPKTIEKVMQLINSKGTLQYSVPHGYEIITQVSVPRLFLADLQALPHNLPVTLYRNFERMATNILEIIRGENTYTKMQF